VPLGYDWTDASWFRNPKEADLVSKIFSLYLETGFVGKLSRATDRERSEKLITRPVLTGGVAFARGALSMCSNRLYLGETPSDSGTRRTRGSYREALGSGSASSTATSETRNQFEGGASSLLTGW